MRTVAVIQPYFFPYAGYFRLFAAADVVVLLDSVQFPRRGWVHRNRFRLATGEHDWLTLPLERAPRETRIAELRFSSEAVPRLEAQIRRFPLIQHAARVHHPLLEQMLAISSADVATYLCNLLSATAAALGLSRPTLRSSSLPLSADMKGQERIIAIVLTLGGTRYVNPSGGRELYDHKTFDRASLELRFLSPFRGNMESILTRILTEPLSTLKADIVNQTIQES